MRFFCRTKLGEVINEVIGLKLSKSFSLWTRNLITLKVKIPSIVGCPTLTGPSDPLGTQSK